MPDINGLVARAIAWEKNHQRKIMACLVFALAHPAQVHATALSIAQQIAALFAGVQ